MINLLKETTDVLKKYDKTTDEVLWVGSIDGEYAITWDEFMEIAGEINYDDGYGGQEIATDLIIVGDNWWFERSEYDGSEWWEFKTIPKKQLNAKKFTTIYTGPMAWQSIHELETKRWR